MKYAVKGMSCAVCQRTVEKTALSIKGVEKVNVNLLTNSMDVDGVFDEKELTKAIKASGYGIKPIKKESMIEENDITNRQTTRNLLFRFVLSLILLVPLMIVSMGHNYIGLTNIFVIATIELILTLLIIGINYKYFLKGIAALFKLNPNMDSLVSIGAGTSFVYSLYLYISLIVGHSHNVHGLYFESAATILTLITFGKTLEAYSKGKTGDAIKSFVAMTPKTAVVLVDGIEKTIKASEIKVGDIFIVRPGDSVPVDGVVIDGVSSIDESMLTGESVPVDKTINSNVFTATINTTGYLKCSATKVGEETSLSKIINLVSEASSSKAPIARIADKVSGIFVPVIIGIAIITFVIWMLVGKELSFALTRAISVLVISCPCALGLATPVAIMVGNGVAAKLGILFKNAVSLEMAGKTQTICLDKTGTITQGSMKVSEIKIMGECDQKFALEIIASLESKSEHPLAKAIVDYCHDSQYTVNDFKSITGSGISGDIDGKTYYAGSIEFIKSLGINFDSNLENMLNKGMTVVVLADQNKALLALGISDTIKSDSLNSINMLKELGIEPVMLTGDNETTAAYIAKQCNITKFYAGIKPDEKERIVNDISNTKITAMVGDGINDAPSLIRAHTGIAIGSGTDIAVESADVVLLNDQMLSVYKTVKISQSVIKNIKENLFWAFIYNAIFIPVAAGALYAKFNILMTPMMGSLAMGLSSVCVVSNALRLNLLRKKLGGKNE